MRANRTANLPSALPSLPPSEVEWEDLLVRMEIMQRVLRNTLETVSADDAPAGELLEELVGREWRVAEWLENVSGGAAWTGLGAAPRPAPEGRERDLRALADRFVSLRARNFAMLQRRGLEVWRWTADFADHGPVSAFQVITWLVAEDVRSLAELRERTANGTGAC